MSSQERHRCFSKILWAVEKLQGRVNYPQFEAIADVIIQTMTGPWRFFHTPEHIFEVGGEEDPIEVLAALFHDLVYVQVDTGMNINICRYLAPYVYDRGGQLWLADTPPTDQLLELVIAIFGFEKRQPLLPFHGQNEFLSALVCLRSLADILSLSQLAEICACIEATIPFRGKTASGDATGYIIEQTPSDLLELRLVGVNSRFGFGWHRQKITAIVQRAVRVANRDVGNFASPSSARFLDNTWNLLPETNHDLTYVNSYTVQDYRRSLEKMEGFMNFLNPELVFRQYAEEPPTPTYQQMLQATEHNLQVARLYLGAKLVAIAIIEALSQSIGREVPLSTMMGELPQEAHNREPVALEQFLPSLPTPKIDSPLEQEVLELLEKGRTAHSSYDVKHSPVATFLVKSLGFARVRSLLPVAKKLFRGHLSYQEFLHHIEPAVVNQIITATLQLFDQRRNLLSSLLERSTLSPATNSRNQVAH
jgi:hypothetical protein